MTLKQAQSFFNDDNTGKQVMLIALREAECPKPRYIGIAKGIEDSKNEEEGYSVFGHTLSGNAFNVFDSECIHPAY